MTLRDAAIGLDKVHGPLMDSNVVFIGEGDRELVVAVKKNTHHLVKNLPYTWEGYKVRVIVTGAIKPLSA
jgi:hypothetical protein